ncbi:MAG: ATP-binding protein [Proteobacteria bacterium]|nr:ATP-binding protein [Pseudomonadota bacterium]
MAKSQKNLFENAPFAFADRFLQDHAGQIISDPRTAILELIANSYDAGATQIDISWPTEKGEKFSVTDNGIGMTKAEFEKRWKTLCYDRVAWRRARMRGTRCEAGGLQGSPKGSNDDPATETGRFPANGRSAVVFGCDTEFRQRKDTSSRWPRVLASGIVGIAHSLVVLRSRRFND